MQVDREKERLKDKMMSSFKNIDYLKIIDKKYDDFFKYLDIRKEEFLENKRTKYVDSNILKESMGNESNIIDDNEVI